MWGIDEGAEGPALYRYLVAELDKLGLAYLHIVHNGDEPLLGDIRARWKQSLILNRPVVHATRSALTRLQGWPIWKLTARWQPGFRHTVENRRADECSDRASFFGGAAQGYTDYSALEAATAA
jgi:N-ethylmaleimide reductase